MPGSCLTICWQQTLRTKEAIIHSRRQIAIMSLLFLCALPVALSAGPASARNGGQGGGSGGAGGGGHGGSDGGGRGGAGRGNGADGSNDGDNGSGKSDSTGRGKAAAASDEQGSAPTGAAIIGGNGINVRHRNGIAEEVNAKGRYVMRDAQGRTIVNRAATAADISRLKTFSR